MMREITYSQNGIQTNKMLIIEDDCLEEKNQIQYERCLYMIAEEIVDGEDIKEELFGKTTTYLQEHHYDTQGIVYIKPLLISYPLQEPATYLEIYVPLK